MCYHVLHNICVRLYTRERGSYPSFWIINVYKTQNITWKLRGLRYIKHEFWIWIWTRKYIILNKYSGNFSYNDIYIGSRVSIYILLEIKH